MELQGLEGLRGRGSVELSSQPCDQTQREIHERDRVRIQSEQRKSQRLSHGSRNLRTTVVDVFVSHIDCSATNPAVVTR